MKSALGVMIFIGMMASGARGGDPIATQVYCAARIAAYVGWELRATAAEIVDDVRNFEVTDSSLRPSVYPSGKFHMFIEHEPAQFPKVEGPVQNVARATAIVLHYTDPGYLFNALVTRKVGQAVGTAKYFLNIPGPGTEYDFAPFRVALRKALESFYRVADRLLLPAGRRFSDGVRNAGPAVAHLVVFMGSVEYLLSKMREAERKRLKELKVETILNDPEFELLKQAYFQGLIDKDHLVEKLDQTREYFDDLNEIVKTRGIDKTAEMLLGPMQFMPEVKARIQSMEKKDFLKLPVAVRNSLQLEDTLFYARELLNETHMFVKWGPPPEIPVNRSSPLNEAEKKELVKSAIHMLAWTEDIRKVLEEYQGEPPQVLMDVEYRKSFQSYMSTEVPSKIMEKYRSGVVNPRQASRMFVFWEAGQLRLRQLQIMGVPFAPGEITARLGYLGRNVLDSNGDPNHVLK